MGKKPELQGAGPELFCLTLKATTFPPQIHGIPFFNIKINLMNQAYDQLKVFFYLLMMFQAFPPLIFFIRFGQIYISQHRVSKIITTYHF